mmetsp:Transcript_52043/g.106093  ORF Transcript_52043/g.106093 Transcript_52043/m.106093 type:complete len:97 (-) Transcript_52043:94-384(-)
MVSPKLPFQEHLRPILPPEYRRLERDPGRTATNFFQFHPKISLNRTVITFSPIRGHIMTSRTALMMDKIFDFVLPGFIVTSGALVLQPCLAKKRSS